MIMLREILSLFVVFFKIGSVTFGGGLAMLPILERELIQKKKWITNEELIDYYAISQSTPGVIAVNVSTFVGHNRAGIPGAVAATLGVVTPSVIIIMFIAEFISNFDAIVWVQKALAGINVAVAALLTYSVVTLCKKTLKRRIDVLFYALSFCAVYFFKVSGIFIVLATVVIGIVSYLLRTGKKS